MTPVLIAFIGLVFVCASGEFLSRARWIDRLALVVAIVLSVSTQPGPVHHRTELTNSIMFPDSSPTTVLMGATARAALVASLTARLKHTDLLFLSYTTVDDEFTSLGMFGRVFVFGR